jgi:hypothetical protein
MTHGVVDPPERDAEDEVEQQHAERPQIVRDARLGILLELARVGAWQDHAVLGVGRVEQHLGHLRISGGQ